MHLADADGIAGARDSGEIVRLVDIVHEHRKVGLAAIENLLDSA